MFCIKVCIGFRNPQTIVVYLSVHLLLRIQATAVLSVAQFPRGASKRVYNYYLTCQHEMYYTRIEGCLFDIQ